MSSKRIERTVSGLVVALSFYLVNWRNFVLGDMFPSGATLWVEIIYWVFLVLLVFWLLARGPQLRVYLSMWKSNWPLVLFIVFAAASLFWTIDFSTSLYRVLVLLASSVVAAYMGLYYGLRRTLGALAWFFVVAVILSFAIVIFLPSAGRMDFYPYDGSWRGIFWHRNYLGSTMALGNLVFMLRFALDFPSRKMNLFFDGLFYFLTLILVVLSQSATGLIMAIILHGFLFVVLAWLRWGSRLRKVHYWILAVAVSVFIVFASFHLDFILGFFNRSSNFTGRTSLWAYLLASVVSLRPVLGYGFGAIWSQEAFRLHTRDVLGWAYPVVIGDNGFMDILLHLGILGFAIFMVVIGLMCIRMAKFAFHERTLLAFTPLLFMIYALVTNITLSYFLEVESFVWMILVIGLFSIDSPAHSADRRADA